MQKLWKNGKDNRGSAMVVVIVVIAFVSILISTMFSLSTMNIQMKSVDRKAKDNFYSAEGVLEQINVGLQQEISAASTDAYTYVMKNYSGIKLEIQRRLKFNQRFLDDLEKSFYQDTAHDKYDLAKLQAFVSPDLYSGMVLDTTKDCEIVKESDSLILKGLVVQYTNAQGFQSIIETDIRLSAPNMNLIQPGDMPDLFEYAIVANRGLEGVNSGNVTIGANVYAGKFRDPADLTKELDTGLQLPAGAKWEFNDADRLIVKGEVAIPNTAELRTASEMDMWVREFWVSGGRLGTKGRTYVANDLLMTGKESNVKLEGDYYGFGNGLSVNVDSSAILINGTKTVLDMSNVQKLRLAGSAEISTGKISCSPGDFPGGTYPEVTPDPEPDMDSYVDYEHPVWFADGKLDYLIESVGTNRYLQSTGTGLAAATPVSGSAKDMIGKNPEASERFVVVRNGSDGTVSFKDRSARQYVAVQNDTAMLNANEKNNESENTKFVVYPVKGMPGCYVIKNIMNGKFISVENTGGTNPTNEVYASRDKFTDKMQLFKISHLSDSPAEPEPPKGQDSFLTFTHSNTSVIMVSLSVQEWLENTPEDTAGANPKIWATISYKGSGDWAETAHPMYVTNGGMRAWWEIPTNTVSFPFTLDYTVKVKNTDGTYKYEQRKYKGYYNPPDDSGRIKDVMNSGNSSALDGSMVSGVYIWTALSGNKSAKLPNDGTGELEFTAPDYKDLNNDSDSTNKFIMTCYNDGTCSFRSVADGSKGKYLSVQPDGKTIKATAGSVGPSETFQLISIKANKSDQFHVRTLVTGNGKGKYVTNRNGNFLLATDPTAKENQGREQSYLHYFQWIGCQYRDSVAPPNPEVGDIFDLRMYYESLTSSMSEFHSASWIEGGGNQKATLMYYIVDKDGKYKDQDGNVLANQSNPDINSVAMPLSVINSRVTGRFEVPNLADHDVVYYYVTYSYIDVVDGKAKSKKTPQYIYVHEPPVSEPIPIGGLNSNIKLGESIEVKSNQIAYLVPEECIGVYKAGTEYVTLIGKNPLTQEEYARLKACKKSGKYEGFEEVSFNQKINATGKKLSDYRPDNTIRGYREVFVPTTNGTLVYYYVDFDSDNQAAYFRDYHDVNEDALESYMKKYVSEITLNNSLKNTTDSNTITLEGNVICSVVNGENNVVKKPKNWADLTDAERSAQRALEETFQKRFQALYTKLIFDESELTPAEKSRELFDNLICFSEDPSDVDGKAFAGMADSNIPTSYWNDDASICALVINNKNVVDGSGNPVPYRFKAANPLDPNDPSYKVCLIIATGDVVLEQDFSGIVIARGKVTVMDDKVHSISGNKEKLAHILQTKLNSADPVSKTIIEHYFRDGDKYVLEETNTGANLGSGDFIPLDELVTYEGWTKR